MVLTKRIAAYGDENGARWFWVRVNIFLVQLATYFLVNNEECSVFLNLSIYEFFMDVSYLLGDSERFTVSMRRYWTRTMLCRVSRKRQDGG